MLKVNNLQFFSFCIHTQLQVTLTVLVVYLDVCTIRRGRERVSAASNQQQQQIATTQQHNQQQLCSPQVIEHQTDKSQKKSNEPAETTEYSM